MISFLLLENGDNLLTEGGSSFLLETSDGAASGSSVNFECAELLGFDHKCNFFGNSFNYSNTHTLDIKGRVTGSYDNITGVWAGMNSLISSVSGGPLWISINSISIGTGSILSFNFDNGTDVGFKTYSASIEIPRHAGSGMFDNSGYFPATGAYFQPTNDIGKFFVTSTGKCIKDFSEDFNLNITSNSKYSYTKNVTFSLDGALLSDFSITPEDYSKQIIAAAKASYGDINILSSFYPTFYKNASGISYTNQNYDTLNYIYSFSERFDFESGLPYIWNYNHSLQLNNSIVSVDEKGTIISAQLLGSKIEAANTAWTSIQTGIFERASGVYRGHTGNFGYSGGCGLVNQVEQSSIQRDLAAGTIEYSQTFSNNPFTSSGYSYSYSDEISTDENGYISVSENGSLKAYHNVRPTGFQVVYSGFLSKSGEIYTRITGLYSSSTGTLRDCYVSGTLNLESSSKTYKEYDAEISYDYTYTENPNNTEDSLFYSKESSFSNQLPTHIVNYFPIGYASIITQKANQSTRGNFTNSIRMIGKENTRLNDFITGSLALIQKPSGTDVYANDYSYKYDPLNHNFEMDLSYGYTNYRGPDDFLI